MPQHLASSARALCVSQLSCLGQHTFHHHQASYTNLPVVTESTHTVPSPTLQAVVLEISECKIDNMLYKTHHNDLESVNVADQSAKIDAALNENLGFKLMTKQIWGFY